MVARAGQARPKVPKNHRKGVNFEAIFTIKVEHIIGKGTTNMMQEKTLGFRGKSSKLKIFSIFNEFFNF